ncbi:hypothetical protein K443DRAFT_647273 [Laccaria amethystina LaAM-08-1]|uniref:Uncharacterized protein n=1 Tax=Laccaria amethystina LaAM-08-1 TaxID=1095629 RepID=A0A0C9WW74_9AGAR|nr:hypothetical protein K443DRAFT_647273 [Laccaria amethystina LaAM-08-1]
MQAPSSSNESSIPSIWSTLLGAPESQARANIYGFLALTCTLLKAQAHVQHLWYVRRVHED